MANLSVVVAQLSEAGFIAAQEEARELMQCSYGNAATLEAMIARRVMGEPLAWITGVSMFCGLKINVDRDVYVPRWQSETLARRASERLPHQGTAIDLCTGSGAIAKTLLTKRPLSRVVASDLDHRAVRCAESNGVDVYEGDLFATLPRDLKGSVDVIVGVVPYVPTHSLSMLPRDTFAFESFLSYDGGEDGTDVIRRVVASSPRFLRPGGALLLELGGDQAEFIQDDLRKWDFEEVQVFADDDGDVRGIEATFATSR